MSTIGFRFDDLASPPPTKKSFFQRMNESHGTFISQMRTKKANTPEERRQAHIERSRKRSQSNLSAVSLAHSVQPPRESKEVEEVVASPRGSIARPNSDYSVSDYYANMPGDVDQRRTALQGMQRMMNWKQTPHDATLTRPFHISPPQTPTNSSRSWSSSTSLASDMSDEQMEQWLEQPVDAELHRYRKSSAASSTSSVDSKFNVEDFGIKEYRARKDSHSPSLTTSVIPEVDEPEYDAANSASMRSASTTSLLTPNSFLSALSFGSEAGKKEAWRLSGIILEDFKLESQST